jgi:hypothetical protein
MTLTDALRSPNQFGRAIIRVATIRAVAPDPSAHEVDQPAERSPQSSPSRGLRDGGRSHWPLVGLVVLGALILRVWGADQGLPFVYNPDEIRHYVPYAISFFDHGYNPKYFTNPPAFSYLLHAVFTIRYVGGKRALRMFLEDPGDVFLTARIVTACLGVVSVWLLYLVGSRLFSQRVGLFSSALMAAAFLPIVYSHQALNDVPALVPITLSILGCVGILRRGKPIDYAVAGAGLGFAGATKYLGGVVLLPLVIGSAMRAWPAVHRRSALVGFGVALIAAVSAFFIANPFALLDFRVFRSGVSFLAPHRIGRASATKFGSRFDNGWVFYLQSLTWGLGWIPTSAAAVGSALLMARDRAAAALLVPAPVVFVLYMGAHARYFGRWMLPIYPFLALIAGYAVVAAIDAVRRRISRFVPAIGVIAVVLLLAQPLVHAIHSDVVMTRSNTREVARQWIFGHIPAGSLIVVEPIPLDLRERVTQPLPGAPLGTPTRWRLLNVGRALYEQGFIPKVRLRRFRPTDPQLYVQYLRPELVDVYRETRACWVVTASSQWGRAFNDAEKLPQAVAYYRELQQRGNAAFRINPSTSATALSYDFDLSATFYDLRIALPGPEIVVYALPGCG